MIAGLGMSLVSCDSNNSFTSKVDFVKEIKPLLEARCVSCHNEETYAGGLMLQNREKAFSLRPSGATITPGDPAKSLLFITITLPDSERKAMPAAGHRVSDAEIELIRRWIAQGALWPAGEAGAIKTPAAHKGQT